MRRSHCAIDRFRFAPPEVGSGASPSPAEVARADEGSFESEGVLAWLAMVVSLVDESGGMYVPSSTGGGMCQLARGQSASRALHRIAGGRTERR